MASALAASSDTDAERAALAAVAEGGGALDAVIAGFFGAAGAQPGVLLCPVAALVGGVGMGARCLDGRTLQPGRGMARPRGFVDRALVPPGATVATPRAVAMAAVLHAYGASLPFAALVRPGTEAARRQGARDRASLLAAISRHGAGALRTPAVCAALIRVGGPPAGGTLTEADLHEARPGDDAAERVLLRSGLGLVVPAFEVDPEPYDAASGAATSAEVVVAADARGVVAALSFVPQPSGVPVADYQITAPSTAVPVLRGVPRVRPGVVRPAPAPLGVIDRAERGWFAALGLAGRTRLDPADLPAEAGTLRALLEHAAGPAPAALAVSVQRRRLALARWPSPRSAS